jgi:hypothetical protein
MLKVKKPLNKINKKKITFFDNLKATKITIITEIKR